jgi:hypothetical protein
MTQQFVHSFPARDSLPPLPKPSTMQKISDLSQVSGDIIEEETHDSAADNSTIGEHFNRKGCYSLSYGFENL